MDGLFFVISFPAHSEQFPRLLTLAGKICQKKVLFKFCLKLNLRRSLPPDYPSYLLISHTEYNFGIRPVSLKLQIVCC